MSLPVEAASSDLSTVTYLRSLPAIRDRCSRVYELAKQGKLEYFDYHPEKEKEVVEFCTEIIQVSSSRTLLEVKRQHSSLSMVWITITARLWYELPVGQ